jgi:hypothetical protein
MVVDYHFIFMKLLRLIILNIDIKAQMEIGHLSNIFSKSLGKKTIFDIVYH